MGRVRLGILLFFVLWGCAAEEVVRGHVVRDYQEEHLRVGEVGKLDIVRVLGSPSLESEDGLRWFYVSHVSVAARLWPEELKDRKVYVMTFDEGDILRGWERREGMELGVVMSEEETEDPDAEIRFFREMFGRIGTIDFRNRSEGPGG
jgi:outer membrane protein assembly factor BamE (lipoprotein component of BamABCDE complex)